MPTEKQKKAVKEAQETFKNYNGTYLYLLKCHEYYKIGIASQIDSRLTTLQVGNPYEIDLVWTIRVADALKAERLLHARFIAKRHAGEWYKLDNDDVDWITSLIKIDKQNG